MSTPFFTDKFHVLGGSPLVYRLDELPLAYHVPSNSRRSLQGTLRKGRSGGDRGCGRQRTGDPRFRRAAPASEWETETNSGHLMVEQQFSKHFPDVRAPVVLAWAPDSVFRDGRSAQPWDTESVSFTGVKGRFVHHPGH